MNRLITVMAAAMLSVTGLATPLTKSRIPGEYVIALTPDAVNSRKPAGIKDAINKLLPDIAPHLNHQKTSFVLRSTAALLIKVRFQETKQRQTVETRLKNEDALLWFAPNYRIDGEAREYEPNDPLFADQLHHRVMQNPQAWNITTGQAEVVVAVTDDGVDIQHEDLAASIWRNKDEIPGNNIDDDGNGYVDDVHG